MMHAPASTIRFDFSTDPDIRVLDAAIEYFRAGAVPVFLHGIEGGKCTCGKSHDQKTNGKHPILRNWQSSIPKDENAIHDQFQSIKVAAPNVGLVLGAQQTGDYLIAIDKDSEERFDELTGEFGALPKTPRCDSGRGHRLFYRLPAGIPTDRLKNVTGIGGQPGVDAKVKGGQVVVAPSKHFLGGVYSWVADTMGALAELPMTWVDALIAEPLPPPFAREYTPETIRADDRAKRKLERYLERAVIEECSRLSRMPEGLRNTYLHRKAISLLSLVNGCFIPARWGYVLSELDRAARAAGLSGSEVRKTLTSAENFVTREGATRGPRPVVDPPTSSPPSGGEPPTNGAAPSAQPAPEGEPSPQRYPLIVLVQDRGQNAAIAENVARVLSHHPEWNGGPRRDMLGQTVRWSNPLPSPIADIPRSRSAIADEDRAVVQAWALGNFQVRAGLDVVREGIDLAARRHSYDSLMEYVERLPQHDGAPRLDFWLTTYFGAADARVIRRIGRAWLTSAMARALYPGCVADGMLILEGQEGTGKNWGIEELFGNEWVSQLGRYKIGEDSEADRLAGMWWVLHDDELRFRKMQKDAMFSWITRKTDTFRLQHKKEILTVPRRAVVVGSKNPPYQYLDDGENRRFWPVRTGRIDIAAIKRDREQLLAEALLLARRQDPSEWIIEKDDPIWEDLAEERAERIINDPLVMDVMQVLPHDAEIVTTRWILNELGVPPERRKQMDQAVATALERLGYTSQRAPRTVPGRPRIHVRSGVVLGGKMKVYS